MDEISREMNMSKKTLYQYFEDKDDIAIVRHANDGRIL